MHLFFIRASAAVLVAMSICAPADARQIVIERTETSEPLMMPGAPMRGPIRKANMGAASSLASRQSRR